MRRRRWAPVTIQFSPTAPFADLLALYPFLDGAPGTSLFGAEDTPLVLMAANGVRLTFAAAAIVQMPDLALTRAGRGGGSGDVPGARRAVVAGDGGESAGDDRYGGVPALRRDAAAACR